MKSHGPRAYVRALDRPRLDSALLTLKIQRNSKYCHWTRQEAERDTNQFAVQAARAERLCFFDRLSRDLTADDDVFSHSRCVVSAMRWVSRDALSVAPALVLRSALPCSALASPPASPPLASASSSRAFWARSSLFLCAPALARCVLFILQAGVELFDFFS